MGLGLVLGLGFGFGPDLAPLKVWRLQSAPAWQSVQLAWPSLEKVSASHSSHCPCPYLSW